MHQPPRKPRVTRSAFAARFKTEKARQQRRYCDAFELWRQCKVRHCRRDAACRGDQNACLKRVFGTVLHHDQWQARENILAKTPLNIGAPELAARQCMPLDFYRESTAQVVAQYFARFEPKRSR